MDAYQVVYHGSANHFDSFQLDKINSGYGGQNFGHGFYFTNIKSTAATFASIASTKVESALLFDGSEIEIWADAYYDGLLSDDEFQVGYEYDLTHLIDTDPSNAFTRFVDNVKNDGTLDELDTAKKLVERFQYVEQKHSEGFLYEVKIPSSTKLLDYNQKIADQPLEVRLKLLSQCSAVELSDYSQSQVEQALDTLSGAMKVDSFESKVQALSLVGRFLAQDKLTGKDVLRELEEKLGEQAAAMKLKDCGIDGLKHENYGMDGEHYYVVWNEEAVSIEKIHHLENAKEYAEQLRKEESGLISRTKSSLGFR